MRSNPVKENPIGSAVSEIHIHRQTDKHTSCYFIRMIKEKISECNCKYEVAAFMRGDKT